MTTKANKEKQDLSGILLPANKLDFDKHKDIQRTSKPNRSEQVFQSCGEPFAYEATDF